MSHPDTVARNFVRRYGADRLRRLIDLIAAGESGQVIASEFGVTRERVRQWKNAFGHSVQVYQVHADVWRVLDEADAPSSGAP